MNMRNIKLTIEYDGTRHRGWQSPKKGNDTSISGKINEVLRRMTEEDVTLFCGEKTEPGVHAVCQTANFKTVSEMSTTDIRQYLNHYLPMDIAVQDVTEVSERFHAELNPHNITYRYRILTGDTEDVFQRKYVDFRRELPDVERMKSAAKQFLGKHDFRGFSSGKTKKSTERELIELRILDTIFDEKKDVVCGDEGRFPRIEGCGLSYKEVDILLKANGFLKQMPQKIVGTLLDIGYGMREESCVESIFAGDEPASQNYVNHALFLEKEEYYL